MDHTVPGGLNTSQGAPRLFADQIRYADSGVAPEENALAGWDSPAVRPAREHCPAEHGPFPGSEAIRLEIAHEGWFGGRELPLGAGELEDRRPAAEYPLAHPLAVQGDEPAADDGHSAADDTGYAAGDPYAGYEEIAAERSFTRLYARPWADPGRPWPAS